MKAEIITVGTELLLGEIIDTNSNFLARQLPSLGIDLYFISIIGDNQQRLVTALNQAWTRSNLIITTGGLGPTQDDITRESIAEFFNEKLAVDSVLATNLKKYFCHRKQDMPQNNLKQAMLIPSAKPLINARGTAPGWWVERNDHIITALPGPPYEMQLMWTKEVLPELEHRIGTEVIMSRTLKTFGLGESRVDELVTPYLNSTNPTLGIYSKRDGIHLRITAKASTSYKALQLINKREIEIRKILSDYIWGTDTEILGDMIGQLLVTKGLSLSIMESGTDGAIINTISNGPKSAQYFKGGIAVPYNNLKGGWGIDADIISRYTFPSIEIAEAMAKKVRDRFGADIGIGIATGMESAEAKRQPVGSMFIVIDEGSVNHKYSRIIPGQYEQIRDRIVTSVLFELRKILNHGGNPCT
jgi:nicotinamide-nucleotide amidase